MFEIIKKTLDYVYYFTEILFYRIPFMAKLYIRLHTPAVKKEIALSNISESDKRATISSFHGMAVHLGSGIGWILSGWLMDYLTIQQCWMLSSIVILIATFLALGLRKK